MVDQRKPNPVTRHTPHALRNIDILITPATLFTVAWVLMMISIPIIGWVGDDYFEIGVMLGVLLQAASVLTILQQAWGSKAILRMAILIVPLAWLLEFNGSHTGFPFGSYHYSNLLHPQLGGVPLIIPIAWLMMLPVSWAVALAILDKHASRTHSAHSGQATHYALRFALLSGLAMTAWDLFLDPQMVGWGYWVWANPGGYFGIPWGNYVGWWISSALITALVLRFLQPKTLPVKPLRWIYAITWALQSIGLGIFWGQPGPALVGFVGMGGLLVLSFTRMSRSK